MPVPKVKIYAKAQSPRLEYIAGIILGNILGLEWEIVTDRRKIGKHPLINYTGESLSGAFKISPDNLLFETGIRRREIIVTQWNNLPVFFQAPDGADFPFDIFSASFYMVTRYEEYLEHLPDEHGRFRASSSLAFMNGFLDRPVVDLWTREFSIAFLKKYPSLAFIRHEFKALLTIDSDQPFAYLGRKLIVSMGGLIRDIATKKENVAERIRVVRHDKKDPYEVYDYILEKAEENGTETMFFFPSGDHTKYDKNPSWKNMEYRDLISRITSRHGYGIHPSYFAAENFDILEKELYRLKAITGKEITSSRFHFLRLFLPVSYRDLARLGITEDYTMGFADEPGFRAGIARPFFFYDLKEEKLTSMKVIPFQVMDVTLYNYKNLDPESSFRIVKKLIDETRKSGGLFVSLWHNTSLLETTEWKGWRMFFEQMLKEQQS